MQFCKYPSSLFNTACATSISYEFLNATNLTNDVHHIKCHATYDFVYLR